MDKYIAEYEGIISSMLAKAQKKGASAAEVHIAKDNGFSIEARNGDVDTFEHHQDKSIGITVFMGQRKGIASGSDLREESLDNLLDAACNIAKFTEEDPCAGLADKNRLATNFFDLDLYHPWSITPNEAIKKAIACEETALSNPLISQSEGVHVNTHQGFSCYGNSNGFLASTKGTRHSLSCALIAGKGDDMQRDYSYTISRRDDQLKSIDLLADDAVARTIRRLHAKSVKTQKGKVLFSPEMARGLLNHFISAISGGNLYRKASFLVGALNKQLFPNHISIHERPHLSRGIASALYDSEGVATKEKNFVEQGILKSYALGSYSARKLGLVSTANAGGIHNLSISSKKMADIEDLLVEMDSGVFVTELMGQGVNLLTGNYSRGASGFWVEAGKIQYPIEGFTIAGNLADIFQSIVAIGSDIDKRGNIQTGSILVSEMMIAGE